MEPRQLSCRRRKTGHRCAPRGHPKSTDQLSAWALCTRWNVNFEFRVARKDLGPRTSPGGTQPSGRSDSAGSMSSSWRAHDPR